MSRKVKQRRDSRRELLSRLGERVRACRQERGLTQAELAESLDVSVAYVSLIERGLRNPPYVTLLAIANALGVSARELVPEGPGKPPRRR